MYSVVEKKLIRGPSGVGRGMLACCGVSLDLSEIVRLASLNNRTIMT